MLFRNGDGLLSDRAEERYQGKCGIRVIGLYLESFSQSRLLRRCAFCKKMFRGCNRLCITSVPILCSS